MWKMGVFKASSVLLLNLVLVLGDGSDAIDNSLELAQSLNLERQQHIEEICKQNPPSFGLDDLTPQQLDHIILDDEHKLLYCYVPKVSPTIKSKFLIFTRKNMTTMKRYNG